MDVLLVEHAHNPRGDFVVNNGLVVLANDVNAEFLEKKSVVKRVTEFFTGGVDLRRCRRF